MTDVAQALHAFRRDGDGTALCAAVPFLTFLGVGVDREPSWGQMISDATPNFSTAWWYMLFPGIALVLTVLAFNFVGDAMQDALNPRKRRS